MCGDNSTTFYLCFYRLIRRYVVWDMCDKSTTFYLCFYLLIRRLCSVGHVWRQVNHVLFVFLSYLVIRWLCMCGTSTTFYLCGDKSTTFYLCFYLLIRWYVVWDMCGDKSTTFYLCFYLLIRWLCSVEHVWRQVNHGLIVLLSYN